MAFFIATGDPDSCGSGCAAWIAAEGRIDDGTPRRGIEQTGFSLQKIGTGEGAQAYGWGLYFASKREVAEYYRNQLAPPAMPIFEALSAEENALLPDWVLERIGNAEERVDDPTIKLRLGRGQAVEILENFKQRVAEDEASIQPATQAEVDAAAAAGWGTLYKVGEPKAAQPWNIESR